MIFSHNVVWIIFSQLEQRSLTNFEELVNGSILKWFIGEGIDKDKGDEDEPEKAECVWLEVRNEWEAKHLEKGLVFGLNVFVKQGSAKGGKILVDLCFEILHLSTIKNSY